MKLGIVCKHLNQNPNLQFYVDHNKPTNENDNGYSLICKEYEHNFDEIDDWVTSHTEHFIKES